MLWGDRQVQFRKAHARFRQRQLLSDEALYVSVTFWSRAVCGARTGDKRRLTEVCASCSLFLFSFIVCCLFHVCRSSRVWISRGNEASNRYSDFAWNSWFVIAHSFEPWTLNVLFWIHCSNSKASSISVSRSYALQVAIHTSSGLKCVKPEARLELSWFLC